MSIRHPFLSVGATVLALTITACGGSGSGSGDGGQSPTIQTSALDAKSASAASRSVIGALNIAGSATGTSGTRSLNTTDAGESDARLIRKGLDIMKAHLKGRQPSEAVTSTSGVSRAVTALPHACALGGSGSTSVDDKGTVDPLDDTTITSYNNCRMTSGVGMETLMNGSMTIAINQTNFTMMFADFEDSEIDTASKKTVTYSKINGSMAGSGVSLTPCGSTSEFMKGIVTVNSTNVNREDLDKNGVSEIDEVFTATTLKLNITEGFDALTCAVTTISVVVNGAAALDDKLKSTNSFTATFTDLNMAVKERKNSSSVVIGDEMTINGQVTIVSPCATGTFTIATDTPLFSPTGKNCPEEGKMVMSSGGKSVAVIATPGGGLNIDEDNNGSIDKSLSNCKDAAVCS